jgi:hypothetical protein
MLEIGVRRHDVDSVPDLIETIAIALLASPDHVCLLGGIEDKDDHSLGLLERRVE